jgi:hypothetical protein
MKLSIKISSLFALALFISTVSAKAQTTSTIDANVPFNFNVWHETYSAGTYRLQITSDSAGGSVVKISDRHGNPLQTMVAASNGGAITGRTELMFERRGHDRCLTGITLPDRALMIGRGKPGKTTFTRANPEPGRPVKIS